MPHLAWNSSDRTVSPDQGDNRYASHTHRRLSPDLFSHGMVHCFLDMSLQSSETAGEHVFVILGIGTCWQKKYFPPVKAG